jgi:hypothetical protein
MIHSQSIASISSANVTLDLAQTGPSLCSAGAWPSLRQVSFKADCAVFAVLWSRPLNSPRKPAALLKASDPIPYHETPVRIKNQSTPKIHDS